MLYIRLNARVSLRRPLIWGLQRALRQRGIVYSQDVAAEARKGLPPQAMLKSIEQTFGGTASVPPYAS